MIAPQRVPQYEIPRPRGRAKLATRRRSTRAKAQAYVDLGRIALAICVVVFPLMVYVMLTANLASTHYAVARAETRRTTLTEETQRLDDAIAQLELRERLATVAAKLHMHDPHEYAIVALPNPAAKPKPKGIAFLGNMGDWFSRP